ncbi:MAG: pantoate--beta-alanine ligase [Gemmatimonadota bacterium]
MDGASRPDHFRGVLTVVAKLFNIVDPELAVFGRKDFQQSVLVRRMVRDLNMDVEIDVAPSVREEDGLAVSSRNEYLDEEERRRARAVPDSLRAVRRAYGEGERSPAALIREGRAVLAEAGAEVDYLEVVDPESLAPAPEPAPPESVCAVAARVGDTRLIDNAPLAGPTTL